MALLRTFLLGSVGIVAVVGIADVTAAQVPASPAFEIALIKPRPSSAAGRGATMSVQPGRYTATNVTLRALIVNAYGLESFQLAAGPAWTTSDHFDIVAKVPAGASGAPPDPAQSQLMLRELLADRFKLVMHHESRELPIYALVAARSDKKLGPQIHPTTSDCAPLAAQSTLKEKDGKDKSKEQLGAPAAPQARGQKPPCAMTMEPGRMSASGMAMATIASSLSGSVQRTVVDRTGIPGAFDVKLTWTPDQMPQAGGNPSKNKGAKIDPNGPPIFTALQEQLGLKLESAKGPVDVLVIDHAERPAEN
jgi:uncharacterized protein (TIGR03435 family)